VEMNNVVATAIEISELKSKSGTMIVIDQINRFADKETIIVTFGSKGEPLSALRKMSSEEHRPINVSSNYVIIISVTPIITNKKFSE
jgi:ribonuclease J